MTKKIITLFLVIIILMCYLSFVYADNLNETDDDYIIANSGGSNGIEFSDGYTGFLIDLSKLSTEKGEKFTTSSTSELPSDFENYLKLAIIECYKADEINEIGNVINILSGDDYQNSDNEIVQNVINSEKNIGNTAIVNINNKTKATFNFKLLKSNDKQISNYFAYTVSFKTIYAPQDDKEELDNNTNLNNNENTSSKDNTIIKTNTIKNTSKKVKNQKNNTTTNPNRNIENNTTTKNQNATIVHNPLNNTTKEHNATMTHNPTNKTQDPILEKLLQNTGNPTIMLIGVIVIISIVVIVKSKK